MDETTDPHERHSGGSPLWGRGSRRTGGFCDTVQPLVTALDTMTDPARLDDVELSATVADLMRARSLLDSVAARCIHRWDSHSLWANDGSKAAGARLARDAGCSNPSAGAAVHLSRALPQMPLVTRAWERAAISSDHVRRLARARTPERAEAFAENEVHLVTVAEHGTWALFERTVAMFESAADDARTDPTDPEDLKRRDRQDRANRNLQMAQVGNRWEIRGSLDRVGGQIVATAWERICQQLWEQDMAEARARCGDDATNADIERTAPQRRADALVEMATLAGATPPDAQRPRPLLTVVVSGDELFGPIRETFNGLVLSRLDIAQTLFEADFERIVFGPRGQPVEVASPQRFFTGGWRRAVQVRDRVCSHPTCNVEADYCQVDHITEASNGGETSVDNGRLLCPKHNRQRPGRRQPPTTGPPSRDGGRGARGGGRGSSRQDDPDSDGNADPTNPHAA